MQPIKRKNKTTVPIAPKLTNNKLNNATGKKTITWRCDTYLLEKIKNGLVSKRLSGDYQYANLSTIIRHALQSYQQGMSLTYQRQSNPKQEISFRLDEELGNFYHSLPSHTRTEILERALGSYWEKENG